MLIQLEFTDTELAKIQQLAKANSYADDISSYCKDMALQDRTYASLWGQVEAGIEKKNSGDVFFLRDLIQAPPANLGKRLYKEQQALGIINPEKEDNVNKFTKA